MTAGPGFSATRVSPRASFRQGLRSTHPLVLCCAAILMLLVAFGIRSAFSTGMWANIPMRFWLRTSSDDFIAVSWIVAGLNQHHPAHPLVVLVGSSAAREAVNDGVAVAEALRNAGGPVMDVYDLGCSGLNFGEGLAIIDNLPNQTTTVLFGINVNSFIFDKHAVFEQLAGRELLLDSPTLRRFAMRSGQNGSLGILPGVFYFLMTSSQIRTYQLTHGEPLTRPYEPHFYDAVASLSPSQKRALARRWVDETSSMFNSNFEFNASLLTELVRRSKERGLQLVMVELPNNEDIAGESFAPQTERYRTLIHELAAQSGVFYLDFNSALRLGNRYFHDLSHLNRAGRNTWEQELARNLAILFRSRPAESGQR